jgi:hypothetical protein
MDARDLHHVFDQPLASGGAGKYVDWGVVHISVANLAVIILMVIVFVAALFLPFPRGEEDQSPPPSDSPE